MSPITVVIAAHEARGRRECVRALEKATRIRVIGQAETEIDTVACAALRPRVLLLDMELYTRHGGPLLRALRHVSPRTRVILVTANGAEASLLNALSHGARGYLSRKGLGTWLPRAVQKVDAGEVWVPRRLVATLLARLTHLAVGRRRPQQD